MVRVRFAKLIHLGLKPWILGVPNIYFSNQAKTCKYIVTFVLLGWRGLQTRSSSRSMWRPCPSGWGRSQQTWWGTWLSLHQCCPDWGTIHTPTLPTTAGLTPRSWTTPEGWVLDGYVQYFIFSQSLRDFKDDLSSRIGNTSNSTYLEKFTYLLSCWELNVNIITTYTVFQIEAAVSSLLA